MALHLERDWTAYRIFGKSDGRNFSFTEKVYFYIVTLIHDVDYELQ